MKHATLVGGALAALLCPLPAAAEDLTVWVRSDGSAFLPQVVEAFNARGEHTIELQIVPWNELVQKYAISAAGGSAPDALSLDLVYTPAFAEAGQLEDLTELATSLPWYDDLSPAHLAVATIDDRVYGLPFSADSSLLLRNKALYREAGLDPEAPPTTWAEIREHAEAVAALGDDTWGFYFSGNCSGCNAFTLSPLVWASGGEVLSEDGTEAMLDSPEMRGAVELYRSMAADGLVPGGAQTDNGANFFSAFAGGNIGLTPSGAFAIGALNAQYPDLDYGVSFLPGEDGGWSSFSGGDNFVVSAGVSESKLAAIEDFVRFAHSVEGQKMLAENGSLPIRSDVAAEALDGADERYLVAAEAMANGRTIYSPIVNDLINAANGPFITTLNRAFFGPADEVGSALEAGNAEMQSMIDAAD